MRNALLGLALALPPFLVAVSPFVLVAVVVVAVRGSGRLRRTPPMPLPPKPLAPHARTGPSRDDDLALLGALRSGNVRLVARALSTGTALLPAVAGGVSMTASSVVPPDLSSRVVEESDGRRLLHVFSTVAAVRAWPTGGRHVVVPGRALVDLTVRARADHVSIDAGTAHHLELSTGDLLHHLDAIGLPRHG